MKLFTRLIATLVLMAIGVTGTYLSYTYIDGFWCFVCMFISIGMALDASHRFADTLYEISTGEEI